MLRVVRSVVWQGARNGQWLAMRSCQCGEERTKTMKGQGIVVKGKVARVVAQSRSRYCTAI